MNRWKRTREATPDCPDHERRPRAQPGPERPSTRPCGCPALLQLSSQGSQNGRTYAKLFVRPLCLRAFVVWSVVAGNNYQLIVIASRWHCFLNSAPRKTALAGGWLSWPSGPTGPPASWHERLPSNPARPDDIAAQAGPTGGGHKQ